MADAAPATMSSAVVKPVAAPAASVEPAPAQEQPAEAAARSAEDLARAETEAETAAFLDREPLVRPEEMKPELLEERAVRNALERLAEHAHSLGGSREAPTDYGRRRGTTLPPHFPTAPIVLPPPRKRPRYHHFPQPSRPPGRPLTTASAASCPGTLWRRPTPLSWTLPRPRAESLAVVPPTWPCRERHWKRDCWGTRRAGPGVGQRL